LIANATDSALPYGQSAYSALWNIFSYNVTVPFTTTVTPTPVPTTDLVYPPAIYTSCPDADSCLSGYQLPAGFIWGVAGSAWQIEGGLNVEGRGPAGLDAIGALPNADAATPAMVTDMNYFLYKQDILRLAAIGIPYYSFSISWPRVVPFGVAGSPINQQALDHYEDVIDFCIANGITPIVTLVHADYPLLAPYTSDTFPDDLLYYSKQILTRFADRVPVWVTLNEPNINLGDGYAHNRNVLLAHAKVYKFYKSLNATGRITVKFANNFAAPLDPFSANDTAAALRYQDFSVGILGNPLFLGQNYPSTVLSAFNSTLLPALNASELAFINNTIDFLSVDPYTTVFATSPPGGIESCIADPTDALWPICVETTNIQQNGWLNGDASSDYAYITPQYFRQHLSYLWNTFRPSAILISEFGFNSFGEASKVLDAQRYDLERSIYYKSFLEEMLKAIWLDGINIIGSLAWSFVDNDEFGSVVQRYGMQAVNSTTFERTYKRSIFDFVDWFHAKIETP
jgi:beta-glucosidase/6-phospho-beta-glucosidase/beta-galactosidase